MLCQRQWPWVDDMMCSEQQQQQTGTATCSAAAHRVNTLALTQYVLERIVPAEGQLLL